MELKRADVVLWERGLAESRTKARELIKEGVALVNDTPIEKPSQLVDPHQVMTLLQLYRHDPVLLNVILPPFKKIFIGSNYFYRKVR